MICYNVFFPEISRALKLKRARIIICISASPAVRKSFFETLTAARAIENNAFLAYVNLLELRKDIRHIAAFIPTVRDLRPELYEKLKDEVEKV